jgi:hypothetical protein
MDRYGNMLSLKGQKERFYWLGSALSTDLTYVPSLPKIEMAGI